MNTRNRSKNKHTNFFIKSGFDENIAKELEQYLEQTNMGKSKSRNGKKKRPRKKRFKEDF
jgi:hypothetical protein